MSVLGIGSLSGLSEAEEYYEDYSLSRVSFDYSQDEPELPVKLEDYDAYEPDETATWAPRPVDRFFLILEAIRQFVSSGVVPEVVRRPRKRRSSTKRMSKVSGQPLEGQPFNEEKNRLIRELQESVAQEEERDVIRSGKLEREMHLRRRQLEKSRYKIEGKQSKFYEYTLELIATEEWERYMICDGLPNPALVNELNDAIYLWSLDEDDTDMEALTRQSEIVIYLLDKLQERMELRVETSETYLQDCDQAKQALRDKLQLWIDLASYRLLRHIDSSTERVDIRHARYVRRLSPLVCCFWAFVKLPISIKKPAEKDRRQVEVEFDEVGLAMKMPRDVDCYLTAIRILWYGYDHYSDRTDSYKCPTLPPEYQFNQDLLEFSAAEHARAKLIWESQREEREARLNKKKALIERILNPSTADSVLKPTTKSEKRGKRARKPEPEPDHHITPAEPIPLPEEIIVAEEEEKMKEALKLLFTRCLKSEVNLRKYAILGGLYRIDLINQPPQPKPLGRDVELTTLQVPKDLVFVEFSRKYEAPPPAPDNERTPEVIEAEMKALETAMEALIFVTLKLPETVMWFEPPLVVQWDPEERIWSSESVHDIKYNEEKHSISFRTGRLGIHGLAASRFVNLPFQSWEVKPEGGRAPADGASRGVVFSITGAIVQLEFLVREDLVCLSTVVGGTSTILEGIQGKFVKVHHFIKEMRRAGCDFFPESDSPSYLKGVPVKQPVVSRHLHSCIGLLCTGYSFSWSRWNAIRPPREIVFQIKEVHGCVAKERSSLVMLVTPFATSVVDCTELSPEFSELPAGDSPKFYADVYHYALDNAGIKTRIVLQRISYKLSETVSGLLDATRIIGLSS